MGFTGFETSCRGLGWKRLIIFLMASSLISNFVGVYMTTQIKRNLIIKTITGQRILDIHEYGRIEIPLYPKSPD